MGSWNGTCAISNLHVRAGQRVAVFMLLENKDHRSFCYSNALYDLCPMPFYGKYNDYGSVEDCKGFGLNIVIEAIRSQLYQFGQGANEFHDCEVNKKNFNLELMFEADHEDRLGVEYSPPYNSELGQIKQLETERQDKGLTDSQMFELDRLANKIKKIDTFRAVTHVIVHGDVFDDILQKWYIEEYIGEGLGDKGYKNSYKHLYFKDLCDSIPEYVTRLKETSDRIKSITDHNSGYQLSFLLPSTFQWDDPCMAGKWMNDFNRSDKFGLIHVAGYVSDYCSGEDWIGLAAFAKEILTTAWINYFMTYTRKVWTKQSGSGSQNNEGLGYKILANSVLDIIENEYKEFGREEDEDEDE